MPGTTGSTRTYEVRGPRAAEEVWDRYVHPDRWAEWSPQVRSVRYPHHRLVPGTSGQVDGPAALVVAFEVLVVDESDPTDRSWTWVARLGPVRVRMRHDVRALRGGGTAAGWQVTGPLPVVLLYAPVALVALRRLVR